MRDIIQRHNRLNGLVFSITEFAFIALLVGAFAAYYLFHHRLGMALIWGGITLNCLPVVICGVRQLAQNRAEGKSISWFWNVATREQLRRENPHMLRDTMTLTIGVLLPFVALLAVLIDVPRSSSS